MSWKMLVSQVFSQVWISKIWEPSCKIGGKHEIWHTGLFLPIFYDSKGPGKLEWNGTLNLEPYRVQGTAKTAPNSKIHIFSLFPSEFLIITIFWVRSWIQDSPRAFEYQGGLGDPSVGVLGLKKQPHWLKFTFFEYFLQGCVHWLISGYEVELQTDPEPLGIREARGTPTMRP